MAEMSMNRVIHRAVRRDLDRFVNALMSFRDGDTRRAAQLQTAWANFNEQLTTHHVGEHEIAWPALRSVGVSQDLLDQMDAEHEKLADALASAGAAMSAFAASARVDDAAKAADAVTTLRTVAGEHLDHEEAEIEPVLLAKRDTPELKAMGRKFARVSPAEAGTLTAWVQDGATAEERAALRQNIPAPVVAIFNAVFGRKYRRTISPTWRSA
jgi:hemerythrin-like domain-containing protein